MRLKDKICIITGSANGIGLAAAHKFAREGAVVIVCDINKEQVAHAVRAIDEAGGRAEGHVVDVVDRATVDAMASAVREQHGSIDALVNNAGITRDARLLKMSTMQWDAVIAVNLTGAFHCTQAVAPAMVEQRGGSIINTSSITGVYGNFGQVNYAAAKAGLIGMTKTLARELGPKGVRVNVVVPGSVVTSILDTVPPEQRAAIEQACWLKRIGRPEELASVYAFLASDEASYVNGASIEVSGGVSL